MRSKENRTKFIKTLLGVSVAMAISSSVVYASALPTKAQLSINFGVGGFGTPPADGLGSNFGMETGTAGSPILYTAIEGNQGIIFGQEQFSRSPSVAPELTQVSSVDNPWSFFGSTGLHGVSAGGITISDNTAATSATLDFSNWYVSYNNIDFISMGGDPANFPADTQLATLNCAVDCADGDTYILNYSAHVPLSSAAFPGTAYVLHLEGTITDLNQAPVASTISGLVTQLDTDILVDVVASATDVADTTGDDGIDATTVVTSSLSNGTTAVDPVSGVVTFTPAPGYTGTAGFSYTVNDGLGKTSNTATVTIKVNAAPTAGSFGAGTTDKNIALAGIDVVANSSDTDGTLDATSVIATDGTNGTTSVNPTTGVVTYTPALDFVGADSFTYTITDNDGGVSGNGTVTVNVNNPPVANADGTLVAQIITPLDIAVTSNDVDTDGTIDVTTVVASNGAKGTTSVNPTTGIVTYTPGAAQAGLDSFTYTVKDNSGSTSNSATVNIRINIAPIATDDVGGTTVDTPIDINVPGNDSDSDGTIDATTVTITGQTNSLGIPSVNPTTGVVTFTPATGYSGAASFTYTIKDNDGATSNVATANIDVVVGNVPPTAGSFSQLTNLNTAILVDVIADTGTADSDGTVDAATVTITGQTNSLGVPSVNPTTGIVTFTPATDFTGSASFSYTVEDDQAATSVPGIVTITVNDPPVAVDDADITDVNVDAVVNVLVNDTDSDDSVDPAAVTIIGSTNGVAVANGNTGVVTFTPTTDFTGAASFTYTVYDTRGYASNVATATITVNAPPVANDDAAATNKDTPVDIAVMANDTDPDNFLDATTVIATNGTGGSTIVNGSGVVTYTPTAVFVGTDTFTYTVKDANGLVSNVATVTVSVNDAPVANDDSANVNSGSSVDITVTGNDTDSDGTIDLTTIVAVQGANGTTSVNASTGVVTYVPGASFAGSDSFTYTVKDNKGAISNSATVTVSVNDLPVANDDVSTVNRNSSVLVNVLANDTDSDGSLDVTSVVASYGIDGTTSVDASTGTITYVPNDGFIGTDTFAYTVNDNSGATSLEATVTITVINNLPVAVNDSAGIDIYTKSSIALDVTANDTDADGSLDKGTVAIVVAATNGVTSIDPINGVVNYTPNVGFTGADTYQYTIKDNDAKLSAPATVTINVSDSSAIAGLPIDALMSFTLATNTVNPVDGEGSWFAMDSDGLLYTAIESYNGIQIGTEQSASGAHVGVPDGTERKNIDEPWLFFGNTGLHQSASKVTILSDDGVGNVTLDFSGWNVTWNNVASIPMGTGAHTGGTNGVAVMNCAVNCAVGDTYILNYYATVPVGDPSGFGGVAYTLHLEGTITQGSIPATSPVANNDAAAVAPLGTVQIDLTDNVYDQFGNLNSDIDFTTLTYAYVGTATIVNNNDGTFSYTDIDGVNANDSFTFKVSNTAGETSNTAKVTVAVQSGNLPPVASNFSQQVLPDVATVITPAVTDDGMLDMATLSASQSINGNGITSVNAGMVTYTPNAGFTGSDSFSYTIKDTQGATSNLAYVSVFVNAVPVAAANSSVTVERNTPTDIDVTLYVTDADGTINTSSVVIDTTSSNGSAVIDPVTGVITYTPSAVHDLSPDSFTYTVMDNAGAISNAATINIAVVNAAPVAVNDAAAIDTTLDSSVVINVLANDSDADGSISVASVVASQGSNGSTSVDALGVATYTPNGGFVGSDQFTYTVNDNDGGISNVATVVVSVSNSSTAVLGPAAFLSIEPANITSANKYTTPVDGAGSWFNMEVEPGVLTHTAIQGFNQLQLGTSQPASAASPDIDSVWIFFGNQGVHQTTSAVIILTDDGNGNVTLDLSGWDVSWNSIASIPMDSNAQTQGFVDGVAIMTCAVDCSVGDSYILEYSATVPIGDASGFGGVKYFLHLEGTIDLSATTVGGGDASALYTVTNSIVSDNPSLTIVPGATAISVGNTTGFNLSAVDIGLKDPRLNEADGQQCIGGCLDFEATGVTGAYMDLVVYLSEVIPEGANYRKLMNGIWQDFDESQGDLVGSAAAVAGACQGTDGVFQIGLRAGNQCLFLRIYDGGPNDADGLVNGTIVDPSGVLVAGSPNVPASSADGCSVSSVPVKLTERADWLLVAAFIAGFGLLAYRRRERNIR